MTRLFSAASAVGILLGLTAAPLPKDVQTLKLYFPIQKGAKWEYTWKFEGNPEETVVEVVTSVERQDGASIVTVGRVGNDGKAHPQRKLAVSEHGVVWTQNFNGQKLHEPWIELTLPSKPGQVWVATAGGLRTTMTALAPERIKVVAGEFDTISVEQRDEPTPDVQVTRWYAAGIGLVKLEMKGLVIELKSFTPGKP